MATLTEGEVMVREGESREVCVTLSKLIARTLTFTLQIQSQTANLGMMVWTMLLQKITFIINDPGDLDESAEETTVLEFQPRSETRICLMISPVDDHVTEGNEYFRMVLTLQTNLPGVQLGTISSKVTIQDSSK